LRLLDVDLPLREPAQHLVEGDPALEASECSAFNCLQAALPDMVTAAWGRIVTISSAAGQTGSQRQGHYSASKGGVIALTKTVALEYAAKGITAKTIPPFAVDTPMLRAAQESKYLPKAEVLARMIPAPFTPRPAEPINQTNPDAVTRPGEAHGLQRREAAHAAHGRRSGASCLTTTRLHFGAVQARSKHSPKKRAETGANGWRLSWTHTSDYAL
jgi:NAD(P)-dependent dehydrogenase (short-subunit alcohol dehydrogenase family)